jgi:hypothetical protein
LAAAAGGGGVAFEQGMFGLGVERGSGFVEHEPNSSKHDSRILRALPFIRLAIRLRRIRDPLFSSYRVNRYIAGQEKHHRRTTF